MRNNWSWGGRVTLRSGWILSTWLLMQACGGTDVEQAQDETTDELAAAGTFTTTEAGAKLGYAVEGRLEVLVGAETTTLRAQVRGLRRDITGNVAHVHSAPCAEGGGPHYRQDPSADAGEANELWLRIQVRGGSGFGVATANHVLRPDARSLVIHDPDGTKVACADIQLRAGSGAFSVLPGGTALGYDLQGFAGLRTVAGNTHVWVMVRGTLLPTITYPVHVHNGPCADGGGTHYLLDPAAPAGEENELWPTLVGKANGVAFTHIAKPHVARFDAQSIVIHDPETKAKVACADLD